VKGDVELASTGKRSKKMEKTFKSRDGAARISRGGDQGGWWEGGEGDRKFERT